MAESVNMSKRDFRKWERQLRREKRKGKRRVKRKWRKIAKDIFVGKNITSTESAELMAEGLKQKLDSDPTATVFHCKWGD